jgi:hypothetical protein
MNQELLKTLFTYQNGKLFWKVNPVHWNNLKHKEAGSIDKTTGYRQVKYQEKKYLIHRLIWESYYGPIPKDKVIDHINQNKLDNRIENLRLASKAMNRRNSDKIKGYTYSLDRDKYQAQIMIKGKKKHLGSYVTESAAKLRYLMFKLTMGVNY